MRIEQNYSLERHNTFRLPVKSRWFMEYSSEEELERILHDEYFQECHSLHIGSGSNLLFLNDFNGIILHSAIKGITVAEVSEESVLLRVGAGELWDDVVAYAVSHGWYGIENLTGIPGEAGAAAVQNIGAYGAEFKDAVEKIEAYNRLTFEKVAFMKSDCDYAYRYSRFKNEYNDPCIITYIYIRLSKRGELNLAYAGLKELLRNVESPSLADVRRAVAALRAEKLPDFEKLGNAGSFFMNPVVERPCFERIRADYPSMPFYEVDADHVKIPAGWMIDQCGWKGRALGRAGVHDRQALVLVNRGGATGAEVMALAEAVRRDVKEKFGVEIHPEVNYIV